MHFLPEGARWTDGLQLTSDRHSTVKSVSGKCKYTQVLARRWSVFLELVWKTNLQVEINMGEMESGWEVLSAHSYQGYCEISTFLFFFFFSSETQCVLLSQWRLLGLILKKRESPWQLKVWTHPRARAPINLIRVIFHHCHPEDAFLQAHHFWLERHIASFPANEQPKLVGVCHLQLHIIFFFYFLSCRYSLSEVSAGADERREAESSNCRRPRVSLGIFSEVTLYGGSRAAD